MRRTTLACLMTALLLLAIPAALAERGARDDAPGDDRRAKGADIAGAKSGRGNASEERRDDDNETRGGRHLRENASANRTAAFDAFLARLHAMRVAWLENSTAIREGCRNETLPANATHEERQERAHCIRDGYAEWRDGKRTEMKEMRLQLKELLLSWSKGKRGADA